MEKEVWLLLERWLKKATPEEWHSLAVDWEWDNGVEALNWIINQPICDKATALFIYWAANPGFYCQFKSIKESKNKDGAVLELLLTIELKYASGFYQYNRWGYDPSNDYSGSDLIKDSEDDEADGMRKIPLIMKEALNGKEFDSWIHIEDGLPEEVYRKIHNL